MFAVFTVTVLPWILYNGIMQFHFYFPFHSFSWCSPSLSLSHTHTHAHVLFTHIHSHYLYVLGLTFLGEEVSQVSSRLKLLALPHANLLSPSSGPPNSILRCSLGIVWGNICSTVWRTWYFGRRRLSYSPRVNIYKQVKSYLKSLYFFFPPRNKCGLILSFFILLKNIWVPKLSQGLF